MDFCLWTRRKGLDSYQEPGVLEKGVVPADPKDAWLRDIDVWRALRRPEKRHWGIAGDRRTLTGGSHEGMEPGIVLARVSMRGQTAPGTAGPWSPVVEID